ncbi:MAG: elongation factor P [Bacteroidales bacterium]
MATTADFRNGLCISYNNKPCSVVYFQHVKPGKGGAFVKTKLRNLENGRILENTFTAGEKIEVIRIERRPYQFLYKDEMGFHFMHNETFEQIDLPKELVDAAEFLKDGQVVEMMIHTDDDDRVLTCELPDSIELKVVSAELGARGDTASSTVMKRCTLETGAEIMIPAFVNEGETIKVNPHERTYLERVKK